MSKTYAFSFIIFRKSNNMPIEDFGEIANNNHYNYRVEIDYITSGDDVEDVAPEINAMQQRFREQYIMMTSGVNVSVDFPVNPFYGEVVTVFPQLDLSELIDDPEKLEILVILCIDNEQMYRSAYHRHFNNS